RENGRIRSAGAERRVAAHGAVVFHDVGRATHDGEEAADDQVAVIDFQCPDGAADAAHDAPGAAAPARQAGTGEAAGRRELAARHNVIRLAGTHASHV